MKKIVIAGNSIVDIIKRIDKYPKKGMLCKINEVIYGVGGAVPNTGITLKQLSPELMEISAITRIGKDDNGKFIKSVLQKYGLKTDLIVEDDRLPTAFTDVMTLPDGERTLFCAAASNGAFCEDDIPTESLHCDIFHIGYLLLLNHLDSYDCEYGTKMARLLSKVQSKGIKTSIDVASVDEARFSEVIKPSLKYCDYVIINEIEASRIAGIPLRNEGSLLEDNLLTVCKFLHDLGVKSTVVIHCPELGCAFDKDGNFSVVSSLCLPENYIAGAVGAGDAFCAGMLYSFLFGWDIYDGLRLASCTAACNLSVADSVSGARSCAESMALETCFARHKLKRSF